jgi:hypothetical protein
MAEAEKAGRIAKRRKMGDRKAAEKWPLIKPKKNLQITRLKDTDLFTVSLGLFIWTNFSYLRSRFSNCKFTIMPALVFEVFE